MLRQLYIILFLLIFLSCKKDSDVLLQADFVSITGTWRLAEIEKGTFGQKYWEAANAGSSDNIIFLQDGAILDSDSLLLCCSPTSLQINNQLLEIKPNKSLSANPICAFVNCVSCPTWEVQWKNDELIISYCDGTREKYKRL